MIDLKKIHEAKNESEILMAVMEVLHDIGGASFARKALSRPGTGHVFPTGPLRKSMEEKALTEEQIEKYATDAWEAAAVRLHALRR